LLAASFLFFRAVAVDFFRGVAVDVAGAVLAFLLSRVVAFADVRAMLGSGFRLRAAVFALFSVVVRLVLVVLIVRDLAFGRLAERRSAADFLWTFALWPPRRADRFAML